MKRDLSDIEPKLCDLAICAEILANIVNNLHFEGNDRTRITITAQKFEHIVFLVNDLEDRATRSKARFYELLDAEGDGGANG